MGNPTQYQCRRNWENTCTDRRADRRRVQTRPHPTRGDSYPDRASIGSCRHSGTGGIANKDCSSTVDHPSLPTMTYNWHTTYDTYPSSVTPSLHYSLLSLPVTPPGDWVPAKSPHFVCSSGQISARTPFFLLRVGLLRDWVVLSGNRQRETCATSGLGALSNASMQGTHTQCSQKYKYTALPPSKEVDDAVSYLICRNCYLPPSVSNKQ